jgi:hypothetical protein
MKKRVAIALLMLIATLPGCSTTGPDAANRPEVREISLMNGAEVTYSTGNGRSDVVTFRRDGTAEMRSEVTEKFVQLPIVIKRAQLSSDQFDLLARIIQEHGFFEKKENEEPVADAWRNLKVVTSTGEKTIQTFDRDSDPEIKSMLDAVDALAREMKWEEAK